MDYPESSLPGVRILLIANKASKPIATTTKPELGIGNSLVGIAGVVMEVEVVVEVAVEVEAVVEAVVEVVVAVPEQGGKIPLAADVMVTPSSEVQT